MNVDASNALTWAEIFTVMKWPLVACLLLPGILVYYGLHIIRREVIFVDLALAQVATLGTCVCLFLGHEADDPHNYFWSLGFTLAGALLFTFTRPHRQARATGSADRDHLRRSGRGGHFVVEQKSPRQGGTPTDARGRFADRGCGPHLENGRTLYRHRDRAFHFQKTVHPTVVRSRARGEGRLVRPDVGFSVLCLVRVDRHELCAGGRRADGVLLSDRAGSLRHFSGPGLPARLLVGWLVATLASMGGLYASFKLDVPTGAAIVCVLGLALLVTGALASLRRLRAG